MGKRQRLCGCIPKQGGPRKQCRVVRQEEAGVDAMCMDLQGGLSADVQKLYGHSVPNAWQVACLQRHGWDLEGVFPGGYAPNSVVQQWGHCLHKEGEEAVRTMRIKRPYYNAILSGQKTLEVRVGYDSIKRYRAGDLIQLETSQVSSVIRLKEVRMYRSFAEALKAEPWQQIVPDSPSEEHALAKLRGI